MAEFIRPRRNVFVLEKYLEKVKDNIIRSDQDVQRLSGQWNNNMRNELIYTVLTNDYIPPIILAELPMDNGAIETYILDGLQRSTVLEEFKYGNKKITQNFIVEYQDRIDGKMQVIELDLKGKTYETLPKPLQDMFDDYQVETVIHENCSMERMAKLIARYNNHQAMSKNQRAFTYVNKFAKQIRNIIKNTHFFEDCGNYGKAVSNGTAERTLFECYMSVFDIENWKKDPIAMGKYVNENATEEKFDILYDYFSRLSEICDDEVDVFFNSKNTSVMLAVFDKFTKLGLEDEKFMDFIYEVRDTLGEQESPITYTQKKKNVSYNTWNGIDSCSNTKDKELIVCKIEMLTELMMHYFNVDKNIIDESNENNEENTENDLLNFLQDMVSTEITEEDIADFEDYLDKLTIEVNNDSKLLEKGNHKSLVGVVAYSYYEEVNVSKWFIDYFGRVNTYEVNQEKNLENMIDDFDNYVEKSKVA